MKVLADVFNIESGNVGIGTTLPRQVLDLASGNLIVQGNVGIGTTVPRESFGIYTTDAILLPSGTTTQRPSTPTQGHIRYNSQDQQFEGYGAGNAWGSLGGVKSTDQQTYILATNASNLEFYTAGQQQAILNPQGNLGIGTTSPLESIHTTGYVRANGYKIGDTEVITPSGKVPWSNITNYPSINTSTGLQGGGSLATDLTLEVDSTVVRTSGNFSLTGTITFASGSLNMNNRNITNANAISFSDPGPNEGVIWNGGNEWRIYECPDNFANTGGNLQFVSSNVRKMTIYPTGEVAIENKLSVPEIYASNLTVVGDFTTLNTTTSNTDQLIITNDGTGPALIVVQTGTQDVADFIDAESGTALHIGNDGLVGIGTKNTGGGMHRLVVNGSIKASYLEGTASNVVGSLSVGDYLVGEVYDGSFDRVITVQASSNAEGSTLVAYDADGRIVTPFLVGTASNTQGTLTVGDYLVAEPFDGSFNRVITLQTSSNATPSTLVAYDADGKIITPFLIGTASNTQGTLTVGDYLVAEPFDGSFNRVITLQTSSNATPSTLVAYDSQGRIITPFLIGTASNTQGTLTVGDYLVAEPFDGSFNRQITLQTSSNATPNTLVAYDSEGKITTPFLIGTASNTQGTLTVGDYLVAEPFDGSFNRQITLQTSSNATPNTLVAYDSLGQITTPFLIGTASNTQGTLTVGDYLIAEPFDGSFNRTITLQTSSNAEPNTLVAYDSEGKITTPFLIGTASNVQASLTVGDYLVAEPFDGSFNRQITLQTSSNATPNTLVAYDSEGKITTPFLIGTASNTQGTLTVGDYLVAEPFDGSFNRQITLQTSSNATPNTLVAYDSLGQITTPFLIGTASNTQGTLTVGDYLIAEPFDGSFNRTITLQTSSNAAPNTLVAYDSEGKITTPFLIGTASNTQGTLTVGDYLVAEPFDGSFNRQITLQTSSNATPNTLVAYDSEGKITTPFLIGTASNVQASLTVGDYLVAEPFDGSFNRQITLQTSSNATPNTLVAYDSEGKITTPFLIGTASNTQGTLTVGDYLVAEPFDGSFNRQITLQTSSNATPSTLVAYDSQGRIITPFLIGTASNTQGTLTVGDYLVAEPFDGSFNRTITLQTSSNATPNTLVAYDSEGKITTPFLIGTASNTQGALTVGDYLVAEPFDGAFNRQITLQTSSNAAPNTLVAYDSEGKITTPFLIGTASNVQASLTVGDYLVAEPFDGSFNRTITLQTSSNATPSTLVAYDSEGKITTPFLIGTASNTQGTLTVGDYLVAEPFDGSFNRQITLQTSSNATPNTLVAYDSEGKITTPFLIGTSSNVQASLTVGDYLVAEPFDGSFNRTITLQTSSNATPSTLVAYDSLGQITTPFLIGTASNTQGTLTVGDYLVADPFDGSFNRTITLQTSSNSSPSTLVAYDPSGFIFSNKIGINTSSTNLSLEVRTTDAILLPVGTTAERPSPAIQGSIRYNSEDQQFEGYGAGNAWGSLGGVKSTDQQTYILATNASNLEFYTAGTLQAIINPQGNLGIGTTSPHDKLEVLGNARVFGTLTTSNLTVIGDFTTINTVTSNTDQLIITNDGTGPALKVTQTGFQPVAEFHDAESGIALYIGDNGEIGIGTNVTNGYALTVNGTIRSSYLEGTASNVQGSLTVGDYLVAEPFDGAFNRVITVQTSSNAEPNTLVAYDADGRIVTSFLIGTASNTQGSLTVGDYLVAEPFDGSFNRTITLQTSSNATPNTLVTYDPFGQITTPFLIGTASNTQGTLTVGDYLVAEPFDGSFNRTITLQTSSNATPSTLVAYDSLGQITTPFLIGTASNVQASLTVGDYLVAEPFDGSFNRTITLQTSSNATPSTLVAYDSLGQITTPFLVGTASNTQGTLTVGDYLVAEPFDGSFNRQITLQTSSNATPNTLVAYDSLGQIATPFLIGTASNTQGTLTVGDYLVTEPFDGSFNRTITLQTSSNATPSTLVAYDSLGQITTPFLIGTASNVQASLTVGDYLIAQPFDGSSHSQITIQTSSNASPSTLVAYDPSGSIFSNKIGINTSSTSLSLEVRTTDAILLPVGTTTERPSPAIQGSIRYNSQDQQFEGYGAGNAWGSLGGVKSTDQQTYILATNASNLEFYTAGQLQAIMNPHGNLGIGTTNPHDKLEVYGNARVLGTLLTSNLTVIGDFTTINTVTSNTDQIIITNDGTGPALKVTQTGFQPVAEFHDAESGIALYIGDNGEIGIGTSITNGYALTVNGTIRSSYLEGTASNVQGSLTVGDYLVAEPFDGSFNRQIILQTSSNASPNTLVAYDSLGQITTPFLIGTASNTQGTLTVGDYLTSDPFDGAFNRQITLQASSNASPSTLVAYDPSGFIFSNKIGINTSATSLSLEVRTTDAILLPSGTTAERPNPAIQGSIRYNSQDQQFEGYGAGNAWGSLGGVKSTDQQTYILATNASNLEFYTAGTLQAILNPYGNLGIGTTSPQAKLEVYGDTAIDGNLTVAGTLTYTNPNSNYTTRFQITPTQDTFIVPPGGQSNFSLEIEGIYAVERSNVSVHVNGFKLAYYNANNKDYDITYTNNLTTTSLYVTTSKYLQQNDVVDIVAWPSYLTSIGNLEPGYVVQNINYSHWSYSPGAQTVSYTLGNVGIGTTEPSYNLHVIGDIYASGAVTQGSDAVLKTNIAPIENALDKLIHLTGYTFNYKTDPTGRRVAGLIAQEVQTVLPEVVYQDNNNLSLAYGNMNALIINAIKELQADVQKIKSVLNI